MGHPDRLDRATRAGERRAACRTPGCLSICVADSDGAGRPRSDDAAAMSSAAHRRRFQSNLQCCILRVSILQHPPRIAAEFYRGIAPHFPRPRPRCVTPTDHRSSIAQREHTTQRTRWCDCFFYSSLVEFEDPHFCSPLT